MQRVSTVQDHPVEKEIRQTLNRICRTRAPQRGTAPKFTSQETLRLQTKEKEQETRELLQQQAENRRRAGRAPLRQQRIGGHQHKWRSTTCIARQADNEQKRRWEKAAKAQKATTWSTPWAKATLPLYKGQTKAESTAAFLLRTEVLGLNAWLVSIHVPNITPHCTCGWPTQSVRHMLLFCNYCIERDQLFTRVDISNIIQILSISRGLYAAIKWFIG